MSTWVAQYAPLELFCLWTKVRQISFVQRGRGCGWSSFFSDVRYIDPFRRYSGSKSKVVGNHAEIWTFFWPSQILGGRPSKSYTHVMTPAWRHVVWKMFCGDTPTGPEVIGLHTPNFKPNFKLSRLEFFGGTPVPLRVCAIKAWSISSACNIFGAQHPLWAEI